MGTFSEHSRDTPLGIFIHLVENVAAFIQGRDGEGYKTKETATFLLVGRKSMVWDCRHDRLQRKTNEA